MEEILIVIVCLILNAFFSAFEMAFVSVPRGELRKLARSGSHEAKLLLSRRESPERTLSVIQIGITLVGAIAAAVGGAGAAESLQPYFMQEYDMHDVTAEILSVILVVLPLTFLSVVLGELLPKTLALRNPIGIVLRGARWLVRADRVLSPAVSALEKSTKILLRFLTRRMNAVPRTTDTTVEIDALSPIHQQYVLNMAHIERKQVKDFLLPWSQVNFVQVEHSNEEVALIVFSSGHTRLPVVDNGNVTGILHTKEFLAFRETGDPNWRGIVRPGLKIHSGDSALGTLRLMQEKRSHMAIVFSGTGERLGVITLEDIIEEVVGDLADEDDDGRVRKSFAARARSRHLSAPNEP